MKIPVRMSRRVGLGLAVAVVVISNGLVLLHVVLNRSGHPQVVTLTNRELAPPYSYSLNRDNSGLALRMRYNVAGSVAPGIEMASPYASLDIGPARLEMLGYPAEPHCVAGAIVDRYRSRDAWVVLEYAGAAYRETTARLEAQVEKARKLAGAHPDKAQQRKIDLAVGRLKRHHDMDSRLFVIDASPNRDTLEADYAGKPGTYLILPAIVRPKLSCNHRTGLYVSELLTGRVNVPADARDFFYGNRQQLDPMRLQKLKYAVTIAFGRFDEPWFMKIQERNDADH